MKLNSLPLLPLVSFAAFVARAETAAPPSAADFDTWVETVALAYARANPAFATLYQYASSEEQARLDRIWAGPDGFYPVESSARTAREAFARQALAELESWGTRALSPDQRITLRILRWRLQTDLPFAELPYVFDKMDRTGPLNLTTFLTEVHPLRQSQDVESYLARLAALAPLLEKAIEEARSRAAQGIVPPDFILRENVEIIDRQLGVAPAESPLVKRLAERTAALAGLDAATRDAALEEARRLVAESYFPALAKVRALHVEQLATATADAGLWKLPDGARRYQLALERFTTTRLNADEIHNIGLREVARLEGELDAALRAQGYPDGSINDRYLKLNATLLPPAEPDPRPALLADYTRIVREAETRAPLFFDRLPKATLEVRRPPAAIEPTQPASYRPAASDGTRPGVFSIPLARLSADLIHLGAAAKTTSYHEAIPGHHYQVALEQELTELPRFRSRLLFGPIGAYAEGWALYAERLADEAGWYEGDPVGRIGYLYMQLFRARRLVVDTGLHAKKWTRQQAIDYGIPANEVERYVVHPGQATSYYIGYLRIVANRERAQAALGGRFSLREFHNVVLRNGQVPLDVLDQIIDDWIAATKTSP